MQQDFKVYFKWFGLCLFLFLASCQRNKYDLKDNNLLIGTSRAIDLTIPFPKFIEKINHGYLLRNHEGMVVDSSISTSKISEGDTLVMKNHTIKVLKYENGKLNIFPLNDTINFPIFKEKIIWKYRANLVPTLITNPYSANEIRKSLYQKTCEISVIGENPNDHLKIKKILTFNKDSVETRYEYRLENELIYSECQSQKYNLFNIGEKVFLSMNENEANPQPLYQVIDINKYNLKLRSFVTTEEIIEEYQFIANPIGQPEKYSNCFDGHVGEYYHSQIDVTYKHGNEYLIKQISKNAPSATGNGSIIVHFNINCHKKVGRPGIIMMDEKYQKSSFGTPLVKHIFAEVMKLTEWPNTEADQNYLPYKDVHAFLMFKIKNGKIVDLCP